MKNEDISQIKYSQNFLRNPKLVEELVGKSSIASNDLVYEIGPGEEKKKELIYGAEAALKQQQARFQKIHRTRF